jgi:peptidoglycan/xylan/chitin deacetylase (PgdA/CDA1 family)
MKKIFPSFLLTFALAACGGFFASEPAAKQPPVKFENTTVSLTFDDGDADNYSARQILAQNHLRATFYVISGFTNSNGYMTVEQLRDLYNDGHEIGGHTLSHVSLLDVRGDDLRREICQDRANLIAFGFEAVSFAYPYGHHDDEARRAAAACGYKNARAVSDGPETIPPADGYALRAMPYIVAETRLPKMLRYIAEAENGGGGWVIFVFHHICEGCDPYAVSLETFAEFAAWLGEQQANGLAVKTVGEVMGGK